jgi:hypothetical protein
MLDITPIRFLTNGFFRPITIKKGKKIVERWVSMAFGVDWVISNRDDTRIDRKFVKERVLQLDVYPEDARVFPLTERRNWLVGLMGEAGKVGDVKHGDFTHPRVVKEAKNVRWTVSDSFFTRDLNGR